VVTDGILSYGGDIKESYYSIMPASTPGEYSMARGRRISLSNFRIHRRAKRGVRISLRERPLRPFAGIGS
jgi:hypothetical protein